MIIPTKWAVDAKPLTVKNAFQSIRLADMPEWTIFDLTPISMATQRHLGKIVLMQKFACCTLHTQIAEPMPTHNRTETGVILCGCDLWFGLVSGGKHGSCLAVRKGVDCVGNTMFEHVFFEIKFNLI